MLILIFLVWVYGVYGTAFVSIPPKYQWILALVGPFMREIFAIMLFKVAFKAAGEDTQKNNSIKLLTQHYQHYAYAKHSVFLAVIVGGVATLITNYCIIAIDFVEVIIDGLRIVWKYKTNPDVESKSLFTVTIFKLFFIHTSS